MQPLSEIEPESTGDYQGTWPSRKSGVLDWLMTGTRSQKFIDNIFVEMCERLVDSGVPLARASLHFRMYHPQWLGARMIWMRGTPEAKVETFAYGVESTPEFLNSPADKIYGGADIVRMNLAIPKTDDEHSLFEGLRQQGLTDYIAWPLDHAMGKRHIVTFSSDVAGGFPTASITTLEDLLPALALVTEIRLKNILARTLLETYVGPHASEQILAGATVRGSGETVSAAIMICDLRGFTELSDKLPRDQVIELLNGYFDAISEPIEGRGGEILKFMGDGLLAIFPLQHPSACDDLLVAIGEGRDAVAALNERNSLAGLPALEQGVGVHVGDVMYGNIGSHKRLDFTVIGPAVNIASRLESLTKELGRPVLLSGEFVGKAVNFKGADNLGLHAIRGMSDPISVFAL